MGRTSEKAAEQYHVERAWRASRWQPRRALAWHAADRFFAALPSPFRDTGVVDDAASFRYTMLARARVHRVPFNVSLRQVRPARAAVTVKPVE